MKERNDILFEMVVLNHLNSAYSLARWILHNETDAEDAVQEASLRAYKAFDRRSAGEGRSWFLAIVRNACFDRLKQRNTERDRQVPITDDLTNLDEADPEAILMRTFDQETLWNALERLPVDYREVIVLRELEQLSYKEISVVVSLPMGTVMSRLARARRRLQCELLSLTPEASQ